MFGTIYQEKLIKVQGKPWLLITICLQMIVNNNTVVDKILLLYLVMMLLVLFVSEIISQLQGPIKKLPGMECFLQIPQQHLILTCGNVGINLVYMISLMMKVSMQIQLTKSQIQFNQCGNSLTHLILSIILLLFLQLDKMNCFVKLLLNIMDLQLHLKMLQKIYFSDLN